MAREFDPMSGNGAYMFELSYLVLHTSFACYRRNDDCRLALKPPVTK